MNKIKTGKLLAEEFNIGTLTIYFTVCIFNYCTYSKFDFENKCFTFCIY